MLGGVFEDRFHVLFVLWEQLIEVFRVGDHEAWEATQVATATPDEELVQRDHGLGISGVEAFGFDLFAKVRKD